MVKLINSSIKIISFQLQIWAHLESLLGDILKEPQVKETILNKNEKRKDLNTPLELALEKLNLGFISK